MKHYQVLCRSVDCSDGIYYGDKQVAGWRELERHGYTIWYLLHCSERRLEYIAAEVNREYYPG